MLAVVKDTVFAKPVLFSEYGVSPTVIIDVIKKIRKNIALPCDDSVESRKILTGHYLRKTIKLFDQVWGKKLVASFKNKTHTMRMLYGNYSHQTFNRNGNLNIWLMRVLGHDNINTSFSYANVVVVPSVQVQDKAVQSAIATLQESFIKLKQQLTERDTHWEALITQRYIEQPQTKKTKHEIIPVKANHVRVPKIGGEFVEVPKLPRKPDKRFKPDEQDKRNEWLSKFVARLQDQGVDISRIKRKHLIEIGYSHLVSRDMLKQVAL